MWRLCIRLQIQSHILKETIMTADKYVYINDRPVLWEGETNILALARKAHVEIPTFCYHSELSVYGACRLCLVDIEGRGLVTSCSTAPFEGMRVKTHTQQILKLRKTIIEMLLANHNRECTQCDRSPDCKLREISFKLGVENIRFRKTRQPKQLDTGSVSLVRDPNKCVLCGDCVRFCSEVQGIGAIDFINRGEGVSMSPAYGKSLAKVDCVHCGQCAAVCPTGALTIRSEVHPVWKDLQDPAKKVVVQIAPAVRVALGEMFNLPPGEINTGKLVTALRMLGFHKVFDTSFAADLTVIEEANEFLKRKSSGQKLPIFTSCCPAWVKYAEQSYPELLENFSSCRSPQQMFGSIAKTRLPQQLGIAKEQLSVVSIMPCTAKKFEAKRDEFYTDGLADVDHVLSTQELGRMIKEAGIELAELEPEAMDLPMGFATGAGIIFGNSGGVSEAVLRYAADQLQIELPRSIDLNPSPEDKGVKVAELESSIGTIRMAVVHGLKNAGELADKVRSGQASYDIIEVMACPGGCIGGAGQPIINRPAQRTARARNLSHTDKMMSVHKAQDNPFVKELYAELLKEPNSSKAHELLHTHYHSRKRIEDEEISFSAPSKEDRCKVKVCVGTSCFLRGAQQILAHTLKTVEDNGWNRAFEVAATFCSERCDKGPTLAIGDRVIHKATLQDVSEALGHEAQRRLPQSPAPQDDNPSSQEA